MSDADGDRDGSLPIDRVWPKPGAALDLIPPLRVGLLEAGGCVAEV